MKPGHPRVDIREQLVITLIKRGSLDIAIGEETPSHKIMAIKDYTKRLQLLAIAHDAGLRTEVASYQSSVNMIAKQATPKILDDSHTPLLLLGHSPPAKGLKTPLSFWKCELETSRILVNLLNHIYE